MSTAAQSFTGTYDLDHAHSTVQFAVRHVQVSTFRASFSDLEARLTLDDAAVSLSGSARVDSVSIVDPQFRDHVVNGADFFEADAHPLVTFRSTEVSLEDDGRATVSGELAVRGVTRPVTAHGTYAAPTEDPFGSYRVGLALGATVDRRDWGMEWQAPLPDGGDALGWEVEITVHLELVSQG